MQGNATFSSLIVLRIRGRGKDVKPVNDGDERLKGG